jgi:hypothetical protein
MQKVPFNTSNQYIAGTIIMKGEYEKIRKKSEGGIYSNELVDIIHSMMDLVFFIYLIDIF